MATMIGDVAIVLICDASVAPTARISGVAGVPISHASTVATWAGT